MNLKSIKGILTLLFLSLFVFTACEETTDPEPTVLKPGAPSNLQATSQNDTTVILKWTASASASDTTKYILTVTASGQGPMAPVEIPSTETTFEVTGLEEGIIYLFEMISEFDGGAQSEGKATVQWSPASRFEQTTGNVPIRLYGHQSQFGSGLDLFFNDPDFPDDSGPEVLTITQKDRWDIAVDTRNSGLIIGSASQISLGSGDPEGTTEISDKRFQVQSLDDVFGSEALDADQTFTEQTINLLDGGLDQNNNLVFIVRTKNDAADAAWNYVKVIVLRGQDGNFLQGSGSDIYVEVILSYQTEAGIPYAGIEGFRPKSENISR